MTFTQQRTLPDESSNYGILSYCIEKSLKIHLDQVIQGLDGIAARLGYYESPGQKYKWMTCLAEQTVDFDLQVNPPHSVLEGLEEEVSGLSVLESIELTRGPRKFKKLQNQISVHLYACLLEKSFSGEEYLLLWINRPLTKRQEKWFENQAKLIGNYLSLYHDLSCQQIKSQLLEQAIQKSVHQLRNPLALMEIYTDALILNLSTLPVRSQVVQFQEILGEINMQLEALSECGQQANLRLAQYDVRSVFLDSLKYVQPWLTQKQIQVFAPASSIQITMDQWQIRQVFDNLLRNAIHFSPKLGVITCHWKSFQEEVLIEIADQGPGLSETDLKQIFNPFYSRCDGGTGLGLAIVQKIVLDHQGQCWAQNLPEGGAKFSFTLKLKLPV
ncbi:MAG: HAMP domain-containing sensor histidine kinase [Leptolyngbyaceae cyanobacterium MO_188.B28]|nr:HAMP domain-containing sensor histidine kinase [Leptolyngbyaceae cyanobacterium MO_188.B28]